MPQPNGSKIQQRREEMGIHRSALAEQVGLSYPHIYNIEAGLKVASIEALHRIANALGLTIGDVVADRDTRGPEPRRPGGEPIDLPPVRPKGPKKADDDEEQGDDEGRWSA